MKTSLNQLLPIISIGILLALFLAGCSTSPMFQPATQTPTSTATLTSAPTPAPSTETPTPTATATSESTVAPTETPKQKMITFELTDGTTLEMPEFETAEDALKYAEKYTRWLDESKISRYDAFESPTSWLKTSEAGTFIKRIKMIPGWQAKHGRTLPEIGNMFFTIHLSSIGEDSLLVFMDNSGHLQSMYIKVSESSLLEDVNRIPVTSPTPKP